MENWADKFWQPPPKFTIAPVDGGLDHCRFFVGDQCVFTGDHRQGIRQMEEAGLVRVGDFYRLHHRDTEIVMRVISRAERAAGSEPVVIARPLIEDYKNDA
jgi:hypothetical protein